MSKCFRLGSVSIPVTVRKDGTVNVGATSDISIEDFRDLAWAVLAAFNDLCGTFVACMPDKEAVLEDF